MTDIDEERLARLCDVLNEHHVVYIVFGSFAGRLQGADLQTVDVDLVPGTVDGKSPTALRRTEHPRSPVADRRCI